MLKIAFKCFYIRYKFPFPMNYILIIHKEIVRLRFICYICFVSKNVGRKRSSGIFIKRIERLLETDKR